MTPARTATRAEGTPRTLARTPVSVMRQPPPPPVRRLVIHKLVLQDFKSYAGRQEIGPFHKSFSSIVGPNGSGKSNVIDALLFVFGWRASKMRQGKLNELIHHREGCEPPTQCTVEVWFREIIDYPDSDAFDVVPGSRLILARTALRNNTSQYTLNGTKSSFTAITALLRERGIDLDHKRFLILQGEVESIAQMPPKARNEHEDGLLEYLEDMIGTSSYKQPIEEHAQAVDAANEARAEKMHRFKIVQREREALEPRRAAAEQYLCDQNALTELQSRLWQARMLDCRTQCADAERALSDLAEHVASASTEHAAAKAASDALRAQLAQAVEAFSALETTTREHTAKLTRLEKQGVELSTRERMLQGKRKKLTTARTEGQRGATEARSAASTATSEIEAAQRDLEAHEADLATAEAALEDVCDALQHKTQSFREALEARQAELAPWTEQISALVAKRSMTAQERELVSSRADEAAQRVDDARMALADLQQALQTQTEQVEALRYEQQSLSLARDGEEAQLASMRAEADALREKRNAARRAAQDARQAIEQTRTRNDVLSSLVRQAELGLLSGFHGRLGSLGTIDPQYDVAISTACPGLNHLVVDNVAIGQQCIEHLRRHKLGRAHFVLLESLQVNARAMAPVSTPEGVPRLFDLVVPKEARFAPAFYHQLGDTLVAKDLAQANRIAYGARRWRVVTQDGQLIDRSGTMSGGGTRVIRGLMGATLLDDVSAEQAARLDKEHEAAEALLQGQESAIAQLASLVQERESRAPLLEQQLALRDMDVATTSQRIADAEHRLHELQAASVPDAADAARVAELDAALRTHDTELATLRAQSAEVEAAIHALQEQILEAGGLELRTQQSRVAGLKDRMALAQERLARAEEARARAESDERRHERAMQASDEALSALETELAAHAENAAQHAAQTDAARHELDAARDALDDVQEKQHALQAQLDEQEASLHAFRKQELEWAQKREDLEQTRANSSAQLREWEARHAELALHDVAAMRAKPTDGQDALPSPPTLEVLDDETLRALDRRALQTALTQAEERAQRSAVDVDVLEEVRRVDATYASRAADLEAMTAERDTAQARFDALRKERLERFMAGFSQISLKLKEMYQTITLGGNAELELVDSLDPFSEGILFSVMPPKKSWKNISNLSGGEKTLSSLALVFALHAYKPTPLYVMDEIDAALDFRNVSIIANMIKERTRGAQFVVISLRNNMFELSSRLVGVYKTHHCTKSLTIDNTDLHARSAPPDASPARAPAPMS
ncbi:Structural maintenance of chromosomes protein 4 [Malassezia nana]|uniref:Structural maintenance of chromosomes protein n=1 Tax=Malassezia nana TaxID=180528 RepID=A0AAF0EPY2_9BASI|nr:Structural maintenance of chromosomes protein 4 [Malassezia nana]